MLQAVGADVTPAETRALLVAEAKAGLPGMCMPAPDKLAVDAEGFEALRQRVRAKEASSAAAKVTAELTPAETTQGVAGPPAIQRWITGKRPPGHQRVADACAQTSPGKRPRLQG